MSHFCRLLIVSLLPLLVCGCGGSGSPSSNGTHSADTSTGSSTGTQGNNPNNTDAVDTLPSTAPVSLAATAVRSDEVVLTWNAPAATASVVGYEVWRNETKIARITGTSYYDTNLTAGATYSYKVFALDGAGKKTGSAPASATTPAAAAKPTMSTAKIVLPASATAGDRITISLDPGTSTVYGYLSVFPWYQVDEATGVPTGLPVQRIDFCRNGCSTPVSVDYCTVPANLPTGNYFYCVTLPGTSCARMEVINNTPLPDQGSCSAVSLHGSWDQKYDVVFIADNFSAADIEKFNQRVEEYRAALLSVPPFSANASKFNFWKIERLGPLQNEAYNSPLADMWAPMVSRCGGGADLVAVIEGPAYHNAMKPNGNGFDTPQSLMTTSDYDGQTFVHEFGHAFAGLGDEYYNTTVYLNDPSLGTRANIDVPFCPQWCSGMPNFSASLPTIGFSCWSAWESFSTCIAKLAPGERSGAAVEGCWNQAADLHNGWSAGIERCDFGTGCQPGTGCFWGAGKATNLFRPTDVSIMTGGTLAIGFNQPSVKAILNKLGQYQ